MSPSIGRPSSSVGSSANAAGLMSRNAATLDASHEATDPLTLRKPSQVGLSRHALHRNFSRALPNLMRRLHSPFPPTPKEIQERQLIRAKIVGRVSDEAVKMLKIAEEWSRTASPDEINKNAKLCGEFGEDVNARRSGLPLSSGIVLTNKIVREEMQNALKEEQQGSKKSKYDKPKHVDAAIDSAFDTALRKLIGVENLTIHNITEAMKKLNKFSQEDQMRLVLHGVTLTASEGRADLEGFRTDFRRFANLADGADTDTFDRAIVRAGALAAKKISPKKPHDRLEFETAIGRDAEEHIPGLRSDGKLFARYFAAGVAHLLRTGEIGASEFHEKYQDIDSLVFGQYVCAEIDSMIEQGFDFRCGASKVIDHALRQATERMEPPRWEDSTTSAIMDARVRSNAVKLGKTALLGHQQFTKAEETAIEDPDEATGY